MKTDSALEAVSRFRTSLERRLTPPAIGSSESPNVVDFFTHLGSPFDFQVFAELVNTGPVSAQNGSQLERA